MLSMHPEDQFAMRLLKAGAAGYMTKESAPEELVGAVSKAVAGGRYISASLAEKMASFLVSDVQAAPHERLSDREFLILRMIASGKAVSVIARELSISVKTVSTYRARLLEKMNLENNAELVHYAFQNKLVEQRSQDSAPPIPAPAASRVRPTLRRTLRATKPTSHRPFFRT
jgi:two-component system invasion response regulator UvrY